MRKIFALLVFPILLLACNKTEIRVSRVSFAQDNVSLMVGETIKLVAAVYPNEAADKTIFWSSNDETVATVDDDGTVHGIKVGSTTIKATSRDGGKTGYCRVKVAGLPVPPTNGNASDITCCSAYLSGTATAGVSRVGAYYSESPDVDITSDKVESRDYDNDFNFRVELSGLKPSTTYYYRCFAAYSLQTMLGEVKSFKTREVEAGVTPPAASDITCFTATLNGSATTNCPYEAGHECWFLVSKTASTLESLKTDGGRYHATMNSDGTFSAQIQSLFHDTKYYFVAYITLHDTECYSAVSSFQTQKLPNRVVDLGLSVFWAIGNLSSSGLHGNPWDSGSYYAWGETEPKTNYTWDTYKWGIFNALSRYNDSDNKTELKDYGYEDDAARAKLGKDWRIPTRSEWQELFDNCTYTKVDNYNWTSVSGWLFTSKKTNHTNKSIFLPAAGRISGSTLHSDEGHYWSASRDTEKADQAWELYFAGLYIDISTYERCSGLSVRPVMCRY